MSGSSGAAKKLSPKRTALGLNLCKITLSRWKRNWVLRASPDRCEILWPRSNWNINNNNNNIIIIIIIIIMNDTGRIVSDAKEYCVMVILYIMCAREPVLWHTNKMDMILHSDLFEHSAVCWVWIFKLWLMLSNILLVYCYSMILCLCRWTIHIQGLNLRSVGSRWSSTLVHVHTGRNSARLCNAVVQVAQLWQRDRTSSINDFRWGVSLRLNYRLKGYFSRHCDMTQFTLTHHMVNKPFLLLGLAAEYRSRRWMRSTLRPTIRCLWHSTAN